MSINKNLKVKVAFEIHSGDTIESIYSRGEYREFLKLLINTENIDLYMVTQETDNIYVLAVTAQLGIDSTKVYQVTSSTLLSQLDSLGIQIYFADRPDIAQSVTDDTNIEAVGIYVSPMPDQYTGKMKYIETFNFYVDRLQQGETI